ncbi:hypothetical protein FQA39_LY02933 [Lamprigera yunnana]|nr:hypothetical protein FQA39_LY02933 [Lamprigera yunnana]
MLLYQLAFHNHTLISSVCQALSKFVDFPWVSLPIKNPAIQNELNLLEELLSVYNGDTHTGLITTGYSAQFINLGYLCVQLLIKVGNKVILEVYKGIGAKSTVGVHKQYYDTLISEYVADSSSSLGSFKELTEMKVKKGFSRNFTDKRPSQYEIESRSTKGHASEALTKQIIPEDNDDEEMNIDQGADNQPSLCSQPWNFITTTSKDYVNMMDPSLNPADVLQTITGD